MSLILIINQELMVLNNILVEDYPQLSSKYHDTHKDCLARKVLAKFVQ